MYSARLASMHTTSHIALSWYVAWTYCFSTGSPCCSSSCCCAIIPGHSLSTWVLSNRTRRKQQGVAKLTTKFFWCFCRFFLRKCQSCLTCGNKEIPGKLLEHAMLVFISLQSVICFSKNPSLSLRHNEGMEDSCTYGWNGVRSTDFLRWDEP